MAFKKPQLFPLTSIRFFLAVWVVLYHLIGDSGYLVSWARGLPTTAYDLVSLGYVAVDVFFVLSGFVLAYNYSLERPWKSDLKWRFAVARFARIYPAYCFGLLLFLPSIMVGLHKSFTRAYLIHQSIVAALNWTLLQAWWFPMTWNKPGWSVSDEAFFYCCFPLAGVLLWRLSRKRSLVAGFLLLWAAAVALPAIPVWRQTHGLGDVPATLVGINTTGAWSTILLYAPIARLPEFCAGIVLARLYASLKESYPFFIGCGYWFYLPGLLLEGVAVLGAKHLPFIMVNNGLLLPAHACVILGFALGGGSLANALSLRGLVFLGDASYAIYILHSPIKYWMDEVIKKLRLDFSGVPAALVYIGIVVAASSLFYHYVEKPLNRHLRVKLGSWIERRRNADPKAPLAITV